MKKIQEKLIEQNKLIYEPPNSNSKQLGFKRAKSISINHPKPTNKPIHSFISDHRPIQSRIINPSERSKNIEKPLEH